MSYQPAPSSRGNNDGTDKSDEQPKLVSTDGIDGLRYHVVRAVRECRYAHNDVLKTLCGEDVRRADAETIVGPDDPSPSDKTGNTLCYACVREIEEVDSR